MEVLIVLYAVIVGHLIIENSTKKICCEKECVTKVSIANKKGEIK